MQTKWKRNLHQGCSPWSHFLDPTWRRRSAGSHMHCNSLLLQRSAGLIWHYCLICLDLWIAKSARKEIVMLSWEPYALHQPSHSAGLIWHYCSAKQLTWESPTPPENILLCIATALLSWTDLTLLPARGDLPAKFRLFLAWRDMPADLNWRPFTRKGPQRKHYDMFFWYSFGN